jgi:subtilisin-like proprotein convertase family protein
MKTPGPKRRHRALPVVTASATTIGSVEVSVDISHTWIGDLRVSVRSPSGTEALHDVTGGSADNVVKTYTAANRLRLRHWPGSQPEARGS